MIRRIVVDHVQNVRLNTGYFEPPFFDRLRLKGKCKISIFEVVIRRKIDPIFLRMEWNVHKKNTNYIILASLH